MPRLDPLLAPLAPLRSAFSRVPHNTRAAARRHIAAHYDLGNELFRLFLDESMTYSCAYFGEPGMTLHDAQLAKLDRICRKLELKPDDHLVEIGTGWGSLALHAAGEYGCRVTTTTISKDQHAVASERVRDAGLDDRVEVLMEDYRDLRGSYSKLVSIEMIEAVGWQYFDVFFRCCSKLLAPDGLMLLQAITIADRAYEIEKGSRSFTNELIFPAGCLPSVEVISRSIADADGHAPARPRRHHGELPAHAGRLAGELQGRGPTARGARLRPPLQAPLGALPGLVRGRLPRAPDPGLPGAVRQAGLSRFARERPARHDVEQRRGPA